MRFAANNKICIKIALVLSLCMMFVWALLGTGASLAWFNDTSEEVKNIFHFADFDLEVSQRMEDGSWESIDGRSDIFDRNALYEPGYTQVVFLKIENLGDRAFDFKAAVSVTDYTKAINYFGQEFCLQNYLKFGAVYADSEEVMDKMVETRRFAQAVATDTLGHYASETTELAADGVMYMAIVVHMPEEVGNEANYRGDVIPKVELGIVVNASQKKD